MVRFDAVKKNSLTCPPGSTCCTSPSGKFGCCPSEKPSCCPDRLHCCPEGTSCDTSTQSCMKGTTLSVLWSKKLIPNNRSTNAISCGDGKTECSDGSTCCKLASGHWGCCPMPNAVCCKDGVHCCPEKTRCNLGMGLCERLVSLNKIRPPMKSSREPGKDQKLCPDQKQQCNKTETCCLYNNTWNCCPFPQAACCSDGHCCPEGEKCGSGDQACTSDPDKQLI